MDRPFVEIIVPLYRSIINTWKMPMEQSFFMGFHFGHQTICTSNFIKQELRFPLPFC